MSDEQETKTEAAAPTEEPKKEEEKPAVEEPKKKEGEEQQPPKEEESTATFEPVVSFFFMSVNIYNIMFVYFRCHIIVAEPSIKWMDCNVVHGGVYPPSFFPPSL